MAHVEALLNYSSAEIVTRMATGAGESWIVEGLIQPGLKNATFTFDKNALAAVELQSQYEAWPAERYRTRIEALRTFFDRKYGEKQHGRPITAAGGNQIGYTWRLGSTNQSIVCRSDPAPAGRRLSVSTLVSSYRAQPNDSDQNAASWSDRWGNLVVSPLTARKVQPPGDQPPEGSDLGITSAKLLNISDGNQIALVLELAVKLGTDMLPDPTRAVVEVNFYDSLPNGEVVLTDARVNYNWLSRRNWKEENPERVSVSYHRENGSAPRRFFGYVATVYYDGRLEAVRAEPLSLINLFPVRTFISPFENAQTAYSRGDYATAARIYRRAAEQGNLFALENLAWFYANGRGVEKDYRQAAIFYERAALQNTPRSLNALAWFLATCEDESIRNGAEAVRHASKACELTYWQEWKYIDTLGAAWAEMNDFQRAIEYGQQALQHTGIDDAARKRIEDRLALYRKRRPVRE